MIGLRTEFLGVEIDPLRRLDYRPLMKQENLNTSRARVPLLLVTQLGSGCFKVC